MGGYRSQKSCFKAINPLVADQNVVDRLGWGVGETVHFYFFVSVVVFSWPIFTAALWSGVVLNQLYTAPIMSTTLIEEII